jgi:hypothetical protein
MIVDRPSSRTSEPRPRSEELVYLSGRVPARVARRATHQVYPRRPTRRRAAPRRDPSVPRRSQPQQIAGTAADYATSTTSGEEEQHRVHGRTCAQDVGKPVHASTCAPIWFSTSRPSAARNHSAGLIHGLSFRPEHWASGLAAPCGPSPPQPAALVPATCRKWPTGVSAGRADGPSAQRAPRTESGPRQRHGTGDGFGDYESRLVMLLTDSTWALAGTGRSTTATGTERGWDAAGQDVRAVRYSGPRRRLGRGSVLTNQPHDPAHVAAGALPARLQGVPPTSCRRDRLPLTSMLGAMLELVLRRAGLRRG